MRNFIENLIFCEKTYILTWYTHNDLNVYILV